MATLHDIEERLALLMEEIEDPDSPESDRVATEALKREVEGAMRGAEAKRDNFAGYIIALERMAEQARAEVAALEGRARRFEARAERLRWYAAAVMQQMGQKKLEGALRTMTLLQGRERVVIDAPELVPETYFEQVPRLNRQLVSETLKRGESVPGARLEVGPSTVRVYS